MAKYKVTIYLNALDYEIESTDEETAITIARDNVLQESHYDILKWADYEVEEIQNG